MLLTALRQTSLHHPFADPLLLNLPLELDLLAPSEQRAVVRMATTMSIAVFGSVPMVGVEVPVQRARRTTIVEEMRRRNVEGIVRRPVSVMVVILVMMAVMTVVRRRRTVKVRKRQVSVRGKKGKRARERMRLPATVVMVRTMRLRENLTS